MRRRNGVFELERKELMVVGEVGKDEMIQLFEIRKRIRMSRTSLWDPGEQHVQRYLQFRGRYWFRKDFYAKRRRRETDG